MKFYLLFDYQGKNLEFISEKSSYGLIVKKSPIGGGKLKRWFRGAYEAIKSSGKGDVIVCWYDFQAVIAFWLCRLMCKRREIFAINLMLKQKPTMKNNVVARLYKTALLSKHFHASVTSEGYGEWLNRRLGISVEYSIVRDVLIDKYYADLKDASGVEVEEDTIFCGGGNDRDWGLMVRIAREVKEKKFNFVMRAVDYNAHKAEMPDNVRVYHDISHADFARVLQGSEAVCLPITTEAPAGLMVLFESTFRHKPIFMTKTATSSAYINDERGYSLSNELDAWTKALRHGFGNREEMRQKAANMLDFMNRECSQAAFVSQLDAMIGKYVKRE